MLKVKQLILIVFLGASVGAIYGALHSQITYSVSQEHFSKLLFVQFDRAFWNLGENIGTWKMPEIAAPIPRLSAALIGAFYTSWAGLFIGLVLGAIGLKSKKQGLKTTLVAFIITVLMAIAIGLLGWIPAMAFLKNLHPNYYWPDNILDRDAFVTARSLDNASYVGAFLGLIVASVYSIYQSRSNK